MIMPTGSASFREALAGGGPKALRNLKKILKSRKMATSVGDEGGFAPNLKSDVEALDLLRWKPYGISV
jgi:enolase